MIIIMMAAMVEVMVIMETEATMVRAAEAIMYQMIQTMERLWIQLACVLLMVGFVLLMMAVAMTEMVAEMAEMVTEMVVMVMAMAIEDTNIMRDYIEICPHK